MGKSKARPRESADSVVRLLDAAEAVFAQKGFEAATTRAIATRARLNTGLIQYHFGGKQALYEGVLERRLRKAREIFDGATAMVDAASGLPMTREVLKLATVTVLRSFVRLVQENPDFHRIMMREQAAGLPVARRILVRVLPLEPLAKLFERAQKEGLVRRDVHPGLVAFVLLHMHQLCLTAGPLLKKLCDLDVNAPGAVEKLVEVNFALLFESTWTPKEIAP
jgi:AcrR family transcriptional regulator